MKVMGKKKVLVKVQPEGKYSEFSPLSLSRCRRRRLFASRAWDRSYASSLWIPVVAV